MKIRPLLTAFGPKTVKIIFALWFQKKTAVKLLAGLAVVLAVLWFQLLQELITNGLLFACAFFLFIFCVPLFIILICVFSLIQRVNIRKLGLFVLGPIASLVSIFVLFYIYKGKVFFVMDWFFPASIVFCSITSVVFSMGKKFWEKAFVYFLLFLMAIIAPSCMNLILPYLYSPPAITSSNLRAYMPGVIFLQNHDLYKNFKLSLRDWISLGDDFNPLFFKDPHSFFSEEEFDEIRRIREQLYRVKCLRFLRDDNVILFYKNGNRILPVGPGVLYSLDGKNPNEIDSEVLNTAKPFTKITGNWYMSRKLMLRGPRQDTPTSIPKALFDRSLYIDRIDPNELHKFN